LEKGDWLEISSTLHQLKGMGTSFGFPRISGLSESIESNLKANEKKQSINELTQLMMYMDYVATNHDPVDAKQQSGV
jgi:HPt (histidine-containing phosphotransfer) domain-containing protein